MAKKGDAPGMKGYRTRNENGMLRKKRSDTHAKTIEQQYGIDLKVRGDKHLGNVLKDENVKSLNDLLEKKQR